MVQGIEELTSRLQSQAFHRTPPRLHPVDGDGFEAAAIATGGDYVILRSKRPNEGEAQIGCSPR
jgi:hypothetical protein